ncbi:unnamed protein product [Trichogramma brassicae]|uniref:Ubiquitin-like protein ATG12 n=1 Tax=Trichogramma brassicae TaxID=86971 RepID=A0A6H5I718_9HYME|nr:unnamed protein product [Trichogramma brassicae]
MSEKEEEPQTGEASEPKTPDVAAEEINPNPDPPTTEPSSANNETPVASDKEKKIEVLLKATGDAPIMTKKKWTVPPDKTLGWISEFIKKFIKMGPEERLFLYINQTFAPAPDQTVKNIYDCYGTDGKLIIHYCKSQAWG